MYSVCMAGCRHAGWVGNEGTFPSGDFGMELSLLQSNGEDPAIDRGRIQNARLRFCVHRRTRTS